VAKDSWLSVRTEKNDYAEFEVNLRGEYGFVKAILFWFLLGISSRTLVVTYSGDTEKTRQNGSETKVTLKCRNKRRGQMRSKPSIGEYLAFLSIKHDINPEKFLRALRLAMKKDKARCNKLSILCRGKTKKRYMFLIKKGSQVIAQFPIDEEFLLNKNSQLKNFTQTDKIRKYLARKNRKVTAYYIKDLQPGMSQVNLKVKILEIEESKQVVTRHGNLAKVAKALIADETGTIKLCLWNRQIASVSTGDTVQIENDQLSKFRGEKLMNLGKKGTLSNINFENPSNTINLSNPKL
jgi:replication factor A1